MFDGARQFFARHEKVKDVLKDLREELKDRDNGNLFTFVIPFFAASFFAYSVVFVHVRTVMETEHANLVDRG